VEVGNEICWNLYKGQSVGIDYDSKINSSIRLDGLLFTITVKTVSKIKSCKDVWYKFSVSD